jgi:hypothetical protein
VPVAPFLSPQAQTRRRRAIVKVARLHSQLALAPTLVVPLLSKQVQESLGQAE